jgi:Flp pilus assembly protein TadD
LKDRTQPSSVLANVCTAILISRTPRLRYWQDSATLFRHALAVTDGNFVAENNLGNALFHEGWLDEAITHFQKALDIRPRDAYLHNNLGHALLVNRRVDEAITHFGEALELRPNYADAHNNLGLALLQQGY